MISTGCLVLTAGFWIFDGAWLYAENWRAESGGFGVLRAALLLPGLLFYLDGKLLFSGHVHSLTGKALLGGVLLCGFGVGVAASVIRQVFAVSLYRVATASGPSR